MEIFQIFQNWLKLVCGVKELVEKVDENEEMFGDGWKWLSFLMIFFSFFKTGCNWFMPEKNRLKEVDED